MTATLRSATIVGQPQGCVKVREFLGCPQWSFHCDELALLAMPSPSGESWFTCVPGPRPLRAASLWEALRFRPSRFPFPPSSDPETPCAWRFPFRGFLRQAFLRQCLPCPCCEVPPVVFALRRSRPLPEQP